MTHERCPSCYVITLARASAGRDALSLDSQHRISREGLGLAGYADLPVRHQYTEGQKRLAWDKRVETHKLLERVKDPCCRAVGVWREDRLIASAGQSEHVYEILEGYGVELVENDGAMRILNPRTEGEELVRSIEASQSRQYVKKQRRAMYTTNRDKFLDGQHVTRPQYGTRKVVVLDAEGRPVMHGARNRVVKKELVIDEEALALVRHFYEHVAAGKLIEVLEEECERLGIVGPDGGRWSKQRIRKLIGNEFYKGVMVHNVRETVHVPGAKPLRRRPEEEWLRAPSPLGPLVPVDLWEKAQQEIARRWHVRGGGRGYRVEEPRPLDGLVYCARCEGRMYPRRGRYYNRRGKLTKSAAFSHHCNGTASIYSPCYGEYHSLSENKIFAQLAALVAPAAERVAPGEVATVRMVQTRRDSGAEVRLRKALAKLGAKLERAKDLYVSEEDTRARYEERKAAILAEQAAVEAELADLARPQSVAVQGPQAMEARAALALLLPLLRDESIPIADRQREAAGLISRILVDQPHPIVVEFTEDVAEAAA